MMRHLTTACLLLAALFAAGSTFAADPGKPGPRIKKCQDSQGRWHYGDTADDECAHSKVIDLDKSGIKRKETAAPLSAAELMARASEMASEEQARKAAEEQKRHDDILLATFSVEADITMMRDRKIGDVESQIHATEDTLKSLQNSLARLQAQAADEQRGGKPVSPQTAKTLASNEAQVAKHQAMIKKMREDEENLRTQFAADLERFRVIKNKQLAAPTAASPPTAKP